MKGIQCRIGFELVEASRPYHQMKRKKRSLVKH